MEDFNPSISFLFIFWVTVCYGFQLLALREARRCGQDDKNKCLLSIRDLRSKFDCQIDPSQVKTSLKEAFKGTFRVCYFRIWFDRTELWPSLKAVVRELMDYSRAEHESIQILNFKSGAVFHMQLSGVKNRVRWMPSAYIRRLRGH